jgi:hypothetical protein
MFLVSNHRNPGLTNSKPLPGAKAYTSARATMRAIGSQIMLQSKAEIKAFEGGKPSDSGRDLLTLMLKANMSTEIPDNQRLTDEEVLAR